MKVGTVSVPRAVQHVDDMSGIIEMLNTLRSVVPDGSERQLKLLLQNAGYNVERAINHYFEGGLPDVGSTSASRATTHNKFSSPSENHASMGLLTAAVSPASSRGHLTNDSANPSLSPTWPKLAGERWVTGYSTRRGSLVFREQVAIVCEGPASRLTAATKAGVGKEKQAKRKSPFTPTPSKQFGRTKSPSTGAMSHILFRGSVGGLEGRLPGEVCAFVAPLLDAGLVRVSAEAVCELSHLGVFAEVPLSLSIELYERLFELDPVADEDLYRSAFSLLQFAHTGCIDQEQSKPSQSTSSQGTNVGVSGGGEDGCRRVTKVEKRVSSDEAIALRAGESEAGVNGLDDREANDEGRGPEEDEDNEVRDEDVKELYDDERQLCQMPEARSPRLFVGGLELRRYQKQALAWMVQREKLRYVTEDRDALSLGDAEGSRGRATGSSRSGSDQPRAATTVSPGYLGRSEDAIYLKDGTVHVTAWEAPGADSGGGEGVVLHPLWERRAMASIARTPGSGGSPLSFVKLIAQAGGEGAASEEGNSGRELSQPEAFFVNVYSRRFQRKFPPASLGCRGGILADEMGMGKTVMLLSVVLFDKEGEAKRDGEEANGDVAARGDGVGAGPGEREGRKLLDAGGVGRVVHEAEVSDGHGPQERLTSKIDSDHGSELIASKDIASDGEDEAKERLVGDPAPINDPKGRRRKREEGRGTPQESVDTTGKRRLRPAGSAAGINDAPVRKRPKTRKNGAKGRCTSPRGGFAGGDGTVLGWSDEEICYVEPSSPSPPSSRRSQIGRSRRSGGNNSSGSSNSSSSSSSSENESDYKPGSNEGEAASEDEYDSDSRDPDFDPVGKRAQASQSLPRRGKGRGQVSSRTSDKIEQPGAGTVRSDLAASKVKDPIPVSSSEGGDDVEVVSCVPPALDSGGGVDDESPREARRASGSAQGGTLVVCPLSMIGQWRGELDSKTRKGALTVSFHYGSGRNRSVRDLCRFDVVLTTYGTVSSDMTKHEAHVQTLGGSFSTRGAKERPNDGLLGVRWKRVILDEAHTIRNTLTEQSRACLLLEAERRWAVTGTPIQNSLDDAAALLMFLRHEPWSDRGWWRKTIGDPYKAGDMEAIRRLKTVLGPIMLRRTKGTLDSQGRPIVELPPKEVEIVRLEFNSVEREFYEALKQRSQLEFDGYVAAGTVMKSYIAILTLLLRLRQVCNHPFLVLGRAPGGALERSTLERGMCREGTRKASAGTTVVAEPIDLVGGRSEPSIPSVGNIDKVDDNSNDGDGDAGKIPAYVQELYKRFRKRAAAQERTQVQVVAHGNGTEAVGPEDALATNGNGHAKEASHLPDKPTFLDSVVGKLRDNGGTVSGECPVCLEEPMSMPAFTPCAHLLCRPCLEDCLGREACCPLCRAAMSMSDIIDASDQQEAKRDDRSATHAESSALVGTRPRAAERRAGGSGTSARGGRVVKVNLGSDGPNGWVGSTKLSRLDMELREMRRKRPGAKAVVFSQWTHMLDLAETSLTRAGWKLRRLDGAMPQPRREAALKTFASDATVTVMLVSLKAGGVGLNLTAASTVILLDPWWNPAVEDQAIDRVHRLGQMNDVSVKRFVVSGTVEDKMLALQEVKGRMAKTALASGSVGEDRKLRVEDLIMFFK